MRRIDALSACSSFLRAATREAAFGDSFGFFGTMRHAGEATPDEFETLDTSETFKGVDRRVEPYIRSQLFIALVAEIEDYLGCLLTLILEAYPQKVGKHKLELNDVIGAESMEEIVSMAIRREIHELFYASPTEYRKTILSYCSLESVVLDSSWPAFVEMKARRDVGVHGDWKTNNYYVRKLTDANIAVGTESFLGISETYFSKALEDGRILIKTIASAARTKFETKQETN